MFILLKLIAVFLVINIPQIESARILAYFPSPSISHQIVFRPLTQELAKRGHEVIVITTDPAFPKDEAPENLIEIDVHDVSYKNWNPIVADNNGNKGDHLQQAFKIFKCLATIVDEQLQMPEVKAVLEKDKKYFDLMILESCHRSILGLATIFDSPIIHISSMGISSTQYDDFGAPVHPILYPILIRQRLYNLSLLEKAIEYLKYFAFDFIVSITENYDYDVIKKHFGENSPTIRELNKKVQMMFVNEHRLWSDNHPVSPNILYMGALHFTPQKELPQDLKKIMDSSKHGVIYVSFGTNVLTSKLPREKIDIIKKVFTKLPYDILWKFDSEEFTDHPKNIKISKWFPQADLLKHPNVKLFITQGGLQSTDETIDAGVPVLGLPMFADQWYNVEKYVHHKIGIQLDIQNLTEEEFESSIITLITNQSYKENIIKLRGQMMERPMSSLDLAVWWTEHVIKFGGEHLQPPNIYTSWAEYYEVKLAVIFITMFMTFSFLFILLLKCFMRILYRKFKIKTS